MSLLWRNMPDGALRVPQTTTTCATLGIGAFRRINGLGPYLYEKTTHGNRPTRESFVNAWRFPLAHWARML